MKSCKKFGANTILCICSLTFAFVVIECTLPFLHILSVERHVYLRKMPVVQYIYGQYQKIIGYTLRPNIRGANLKYKKYLNYTFNTNSEGFRGTNWDKSPDRKNVVIIGDSYAFGWGVSGDQTFSALLEKKLKGVNPKYQIINLAQSGYFLDQIVNTFDHYGQQFNPILVIYLYCYNDPLDIPTLKKGEYQIESFRDTVSRESFNNEAQRNNSQIWSLRRAVEGSYLYAFYTTYLLPIISDNNSKISHRAIKNKMNFTYNNLMPPTPPINSVTLGSDKKKYIWFCLNKLNNTIKPNSFILIDTSSKIFIHRPDTQESDRWLLCDFANKNSNTQFVNFESTIRLKSDGIPRFFEVDSHWNDKGHDLAAKIIWKAIKQQTKLLQIPQ